MRIGLLQATGVVGAAQDNRVTLQTAADSAAAGGAELLISPELFLSGYRPLAVHQDDGSQHREWVAAMAASAGISIVASTVEHANGAAYISASIFTPTGAEATRYRKQHLFGPDESSVFESGSSDPELIELGGFTAALGVCFDVEFPEFARRLALRGADLLLVPTAVPLRSGSGGQAPPLDTTLVSTLLVPARALESQLFVAYANHAGPIFSGTSTVADPYGRRITTAGDGPELIFADLDHSHIGRARTDIGYLSYFTR